MSRLVNTEEGMDVEVEIPNSDSNHLGETKVEFQIKEADGKLKIAIKSGKVAAGWKVQVAGRSASADGVEAKGAFESEDTITVREAGIEELELVY